MSLVFIIYSSIYIHFYGLSLPEDEEAVNSPPHTIQKARKKCDEKRKK